MIDYMKRLGFSEYEIKAYFALLKNHPINGYGLSKASKIPRSRIYEIVEGLIHKGIVFDKYENDARLFMPLEPNRLITKLKSEYETIFEHIDEYTHMLYNHKNHHYEQKNISGRDDILNVIKLLFKEAEHRIALSIWQEEFDEIEEELLLQKEQGVLIRGIYFGFDCPEDIIPHRRIERYIAEKNDRYIIVIIDDKHVVSGVISKKGTSHAIWSQDPSEIDIKDDFIAHDVMINAYSEQLENNEVFEKTLDLIRKEYFCYSEDDYETFKDT